MKDTASAQVLKDVVPGATLKNFTTPKEALDAFYTGDVSILGGGTDQPGDAFPDAPAIDLGNS